MAIFLLAPDQTIAQMWSNGVRGMDAFRMTIMEEIVLRLDLFHTTKHQNTIIFYYENGNITVISITHNKLQTPTVNQACRQGAPTAQKLPPQFSTAHDGSINHIAIACTAFHIYLTSSIFSVIACHKTL